MIFFFFPEMIIIEKDKPSRSEVINLIYADLIYGNSTAVFEKGGGERIIIRTHLNIVHDLSKCFRKRVGLH